MSIAKRFAVGAAAGVVAIGAFAMAASPASADDLDLEVQAGPLEWTLVDGGVDFGLVNYSLASQIVDGTTTFTLDDMTGTGSGWVAALEADGNMTNGATGTVLPADILFAADITSIEGAGGDDGGSTGQVTENTSGSIGDPGRTVFSALANNGEGQFTGTLGMSLGLAAGQEPGVYTGTMTVSINPQP